MPAQVPARALLLEAMNDVLNDPRGGSGLQAISSQVVPPFETPLKLGGVRKHREVKDFVQTPIQSPVAAPHFVPGAQPGNPPNIGAPVAPTPAQAPLVNPRHNEQALVDLLQGATAPRAAQERPRQGGVGAHFSVPATTEAVAGVSGRSAQAAFERSTANLGNAFLIEAALAVALGYGIRESMRAMTRKNDSKAFQNPVGGPNAGRRIVQPQPRKRASTFSGPRRADVPAQHQRSRSSGLLNAISTDAFQRVKRGP